MGVRRCVRDLSRGHLPHRRLARAHAPLMLGQRLKVETASPASPVEAIRLAHASLPGFGLGPEAARESLVVHDDRPATLDYLGDVHDVLSDRVVTCDARQVHVRGRGGPGRRWDMRIVRGLASSGGRSHLRELPCRTHQSLAPHASGPLADAAPPARWASAPTFSAASSLLKRARPQRRRSSGEPPRPLRRRRAS